MEHCPTEEMIGNFFTKATQGSLFKKFRKRILNLEYDNPSAYMPKVSHECAGLTNSHTANALHNKYVTGLSSVRDSTNTNEQKIVKVSYADIVRSKH